MKIGEELPADAPPPVGGRDCDFVHPELGRLVGMDVMYRRRHADELGNEVEERDYDYIAIRDFSVPR